MFKSLLKAAQSLERGMDSAFSNAPASHNAFKNATLTIAGISVRLGSVFAEGGYSFIHVATPLSSNVSKNTRYAVKRLSCAEDESKRQAHQEIDFLRKLPPHRNIVKFYDAIFHQGHAFLLFELVDGGALPEILSRSEMSSQKKLTVLADVTAAIVHLHSQQPPIFIRDVKLENVLYDRLQYCYKLCDFGSATSSTCRPVSRADILAVEEDVSNNCTSMYRAPELIDLYSKPFICERADVWSLGCIWYALLFNSLPFDGSSSLQITKGLTNIPAQPTYPDEFISVLKNMLVVDPAHRYDSFQVLEELNRMLGRQTDPQLMSIGNELRSKRCEEYGISSDAVAIIRHPNSALSSKETPVSITPEPVPQSLLGDIDELLFFSEPPLTKSAFRASESNAMPSSEGDTGWADFDSAFGKPSANSASKNVSSKSSTAYSANWAISGPSHVRHEARSSAGAFMQKNASATPERAFGNSAVRLASAHKTATTTSTVPPWAEIQQGKTTVPSLIDVSDLTGSSTVAGQAPTPVQFDAEQKQGDVKKSESRKAANFEDLIDFG